MSQLDRLLTAITSQPNTELHLVTGSEPLLHSNGKGQALAPRKLQAAQVRFLVGEILDEATRLKLERVGWVDFVYAPAGLPAVHVQVGAWHSVDTWARVKAHAQGSGIFPRVTVTQARASEPCATATAVESAAPQPVSEPAPANENLTLDALLLHLVREQGSDLHLSTGQPPMMRQHGAMRRIHGVTPLEGDALLKLLEPVLPPRNREQFAAEHDTDFAYEIKGLARFRMNLFRDREGPGLVARVIPARLVTAEELNLPQAVRGFTELSKGLVLVTGPTGSGKSTTLSALIDLMNREREDHIITLEDPIEFVHRSNKCLINQREIGAHTSGFKRALRAALREDPDILLVGEMRDLETVNIAIETAETGHLVFGTLHTNTAHSTVDRVIDQFPSDRQPQIRAMLAESLKGVVAQTLCKKIGGGRVAALEILVVTPAVANLIREGKTYQIPSVMQTSRHLGMVTLNDSLLELVRTQQIEPREAYLRAIDKTGMAKLLHASGVAFAGLTSAA
jgi:twitching motility protein PilT